MKERPILFSGPLVRALLEGRKTETRRPVKLPAKAVEGLVVQYPDGPHLRRRDTGKDEPLACPYGKPGDRQVCYSCGEGAVQSAACVPCARCDAGLDTGDLRRGDLLWVGETWGAHFIWDGCPPSKIKHDDDGHCLFYKADGHIRGGCRPSQRKRWRPSIHMPRWASRINLEVTEVRVERLQDIDEAGAKAEGVEAVHVHVPTDPHGPLVPSFRAGFREAWDGIYAGRKDKPGLDWKDSPWVWVVGFKVLP